MFAFKRKYLEDSLEPLAIFWSTPYYPGVVLGNYRNLHRLRNVLSPLGINGFILGYVLIGLLLPLQEVLIGDPAARHLMVIALATHLLYDILLNLEVLRLGSRSETEHYTSELIVHEDRLTFEQRIQQLEQQGRTSEAKQVRHIAQNAHGLDRLQWIGGIRLREKGAGNSWLIRLTDGDDYEAHMARPNKHASISCVLAVFQEVRDRRLSPRRRQQVLRRLAQNGLHIQPGCSQPPVPAVSECD